MAPTNRKTAKLPKAWVRRAPMALGAMVVLLGLAVMAGWHAHIPTLIQLHPTLAPMQYNTALAFVLTGGGLLALSLGWRLPAAMAAALSSVIGLATLGQYLFGIESGIDQWLMQHYITTRTTHPGRMAPTTAIAFLASGTVIFASARLRYSESRRIFAGLLSAVVLAQAVTTLIGYLADLQPLIGWGASTHMAPHTAMGHALAAGGLLLWLGGGEFREEEERNRVRWAGLMAFCVVLVVTLLAWSGLVRLGGERDRDLASGEAHALAASITAVFHQQRDAIERMALRWQAEGGTPHARWQQDASAHVRDLAGVRAVEWVDAAGVIRWIEPLRGNERLVGTNPNREPVRAQLLAQARAQRQAVISQPIALAQGGDGVLMLRPLFVRGRFDGYLVAVFDLHAQFGSVVQSESVSRRPVLIEYAGKPVYRSDTGISSRQPEFVFDVPLSLANEGFRLRMLKDNKSAQDGYAALAWMVLSSGISAAVLLAALFWLWEMALRRADQAERAGTALAESEEKFRQLYEFSPVGIALNTLDGRFVQGNRALFEMVGYSEEEFYRLSFWEITPREYEAREAEQLEALRTRGAYGPYEKEYLRKDGTRLPVLLNGVLIRDREGRDMIWSIVQDITGRKLVEETLRQSEQRWEFALKGAGEGVWDWDANTNEVYYSQRWKQMLGYSEHEIGTGLEEWEGRLHPDDKPRCDADIDRYFRGETAIYENEHRLRCKDGSYRWFLERGEVTARDSTGRPLRMTGTYTDITERKRAEQLKNEFISTVSHELRTPLTSIRGALGLLAGGAVEREPDKARELVGIAHKNAERLSRLINDILDIEKIASGRVSFDLKPQPLMPLVETALAAHQAYAEQYGVTFRLAECIGQGEVNVDGERFQQVMANLLSNAAKFSPRGEMVEVRVAPCERGYRVSVTDRGAGIPEEFRPRVFEKFSQADASDTRAKGGTGLGLAISREIVERMSGRIGFESEEGRGATFWVELYDWRLPAGNTTTVSPGGPGTRLLVVEDDADVARLLAHMLRSAGFAADVAPDASTAKQRLAAQHYDAITLDLVLPGQDGVSLIRELRANPETRELPIVVVSAKMEEGRLAINGDFNAIDWLGKPIDERRLIGSIQHVLGRVHGYKPRILHVEDDADLHRIMAAIAAVDADFDHASTLREAREKLALERYSLVVLDLALPDGSGWELLPRLRELNPPPPVVVLSGRDITADEARCVQAALVKSQTSNVDLLNTIQRVIRHATARRHEQR